MSWEPADPVNILLVADRQADLASLVSMLEKPGYRFLTATSSTEALRLAREEVFAVILLDVAMPMMDGFEVATSIRSLEQSRDTPIIFLTADGVDLERIHQAYSMGAIDHLIKPVAREVVRTKVSIFVDLQRKTAELDRQEELSRPGYVGPRHAIFPPSFLSDMKQAMRTSLNSLLILARALSENKEGNLTPKQLAFIRVMCGSASDLLELLDLSDVGSGMSIALGECRPLDLCERARARFQHVADSKGLKLEVELDPTVPTSVRTDERRLWDVLNHLLSNAFEFTKSGSVSLKIGMATEGWRPEHPILPEAEAVLGFVVTDTGIGVPEDLQEIIFQRFSPGVGLWRSGEIARLLGGEIVLHSVPGRGSTFTLFLPLERTTMCATARAHERGG